VLGHLQLDRWQVEHLPDLLAHDGALLRSSPQDRHAPGAWTTTCSGSGRGFRANPSPAGCFPGPRPDERRSDRGGAFTNASELGGFEEFCQFFDTRASNWLTRAGNSRTRADNSTTNRSRSTRVASRSASIARSRATCAT